MIEIYISTSYNSEDKTSRGAAVLEFKGKISTISYKEKNKTEEEIFEIMKNKATKNISGHYNFLIYGEIPDVCKKHKAIFKHDGLMDVARNNLKFARDSKETQELINFFEGEVMK